ncbi:MAG: sulfatase-like hydrolase/transferase [Verrucomicrobiales bacterium]|nr:sulfatase-like hydrolase/transferase [Verrucomicrobiales bacterium]
MLTRLLPVLLLAFSFSAFADSPPRPNIVIVLCDDLGYGDLQNYGHPTIQTPRLLQMAKEGMQFSSFYSAAPVCSPSRVGLLTGRNPNRAGVYDWIPAANPDQPPKGSRNFVELRKEEFTIPRMLKSAGYATCMSGKWHCNAMFNSDKQAQPGDHGFDHWFATQNNASPSHENPRNFVRNGEPVGKIEGYSCQIVADEFIGWLRNHKEEAPDKAFFGYVAYHEPHEPVASPPEMVKRYEAEGTKEHDEAQYFANVENLDAATGKILDALDELGYGENTLVIFTSDNGPETLDRYKSANRSYGVSGPLRGMKLHTHEAGYRVAGIMRWPDMIQPETQSDEAVCSLDFLPTFAALSGADIPAGRDLDGANFLPALSGKSISREQPLLWVYYHSYTENGTYVPSVSLRDGDMKIRAVVEGIPSLQQIDEGTIDQVKAGQLGRFEIYDLSKDIGETNPLPIEGSPLPGTLQSLYRDALETFHVWPALPKKP